MKLFKEIPTCFWTESKAGYLSSQEKLLFIYLISHPATNRLGCFRLPLRYMAYDLEWSEQWARSCFNKLIDFNFLAWDRHHEWGYLTDFLDWFPIRNHYQGKHIEPVFNELPEDTILFKWVVGHLLQTPYLDKLFRERLINYWKQISTKQEDKTRQQKELKICQCGGTIHA